MSGLCLSSTSVIPERICARWVLNESALWWSWAPSRAGPLPCWGWGVIPDQYGRRWDGDDGEADDPGLDSELRDFEPAQVSCRIFLSWKDVHYAEED